MVACAFAKPKQEADHINQLKTTDSPLPFQGIETGTLPAPWHKPSDRTHPN